MQQHTNLVPGELRYALPGPAGLLECRINPAWATLIYHAPGCDGTDCNPDACDAEAMPGTEISLAWRLADFDDAVIWREMAAQYLTWELSTTDPDAN